MLGAERCGETASGAAKFKWMPKAKPASATGRSGHADETSSVALSGRVSAGRRFPLRPCSSGKPRRCSPAHHVWNRGRQEEGESGQEGYVHRRNRRVRIGPKRDGQRRPCLRPSALRRSPSEGRREADLRRTQQLAERAEARTLGRPRTCECSFGCPDSVAGVCRPRLVWVTAVSWSTRLAVPRKAGARPAPTAVRGRLGSCQRGPLQKSMTRSFTATVWRDRRAVPAIPIAQRHAWRYPPPSPPRASTSGLMSRLSSRSEDRQSGPYRGPQGRQQKGSREPGCSAQCLSG